MADPPDAKRRLAGGVAGTGERRCAGNVGAVRRIEGGEVELVVGQLRAVRAVEAHLEGVHERDVLGLRGGAVVGSVEDVFADADVVRRGEVLHARVDQAAAVHGIPSVGAAGVRLGRGPDRADRAEVKISAVRDGLAGKLHAHVSCAAVEHRASDFAVAADRPEAGLRAVGDLSDEERIVVGVVLREKAEFAAGHFELSDCPGDIADLVGRNAVHQAGRADRHRPARAGDVAQADLRHAGERAIDRERPDARGAGTDEEGVVVKRERALHLEGAGPVVADEEMLEFCGVGYRAAEVDECPDAARVAADGEFAVEDEVAGVGEGAVAIAAGEEVIDRHIAAVRHDARIALHVADDEFAARLGHGRAILDDDAVAVPLAGADRHAGEGGPRRAGAQGDETAGIVVGVVADHGGAVRRQASASLDFEKDFPGRTLRVADG